MSKVIQIAACVAGETAQVGSVVQGVFRPAIFALCADGSIWGHQDGEWTKAELPPGMQDEHKADRTVESARSFEASREI